MSAEEVAEFEKHPNIREIVKVRYLDDAGKVAGVVTPGFVHYAPMVQRVVDAHCAGLRT
jgi:predicted HD phosphohydrolase